jgi:hypothetical protein
MADVTISGLSPASPNKDTASIPFTDGSTTFKTNPSGIVAASPGCIIQVKSFTYTAKFLTTSNVATSAFFVNITPTSVNSSFLVSASLTRCCDSWNNGPHYTFIDRHINGVRTQLYYTRANNWAGGANDTWNNVFAIPMEVLDAPNTVLPLRYVVSIASLASTQSAINGRARSDESTIWGNSTITVREIAG